MLVGLPVSKHWIQGFGEEESRDGKFDVRPSGSSSLVDVSQLFLISLLASGKGDFEAYE